MQVIDSRKLSADENLWLKSLSNRLDPLDVLEINNAVTEQGKDARINAYMNAIAQANYNAIEEAAKMSKPAKSLEEVLIRIGFAAEMEARGEERKALDIAQNIINMGLSFETIVSATELDPEKVKTLYQQN